MFEWFKSLSKSHKMFVGGIAFIALVALADKVFGFEGCKTAVEADQYLMESGDQVVATGNFGGTRHFLVQRASDGTFYDVYVVMTPTDPMICAGEDFGINDPRKISFRA